MSGFVPIQTERLVLRAISSADRPHLIELANNWRVAKNLSTMPFPYTPGSADEWIAKQDELWAGGKAIPLAITLDGRFIGGIGINVRDHQNWELGYWIGERFWNRGYVSEAAEALRDHAFEALKLELIVAGHMADNHASGRILAKLGFRYTKETPRYCLARGANVRCLDMELTRARWHEMCPRQFVAAAGA
jgi:ribosomal-protein-alanine N-acetyltransferase